LKKRSKKLRLLQATGAAPSRHQINKSFLVLFFKKARLPSPCLNQTLQPQQPKRGHGGGIFGAFQSSRSSNLPHLPPIASFHLCARQEITACVRENHTRHALINPADDAPRRGPDTR
jgi:hypothetical protein